MSAGPVVSSPPPTRAEPRAQHRVRRRIVWAVLVVLLLVAGLSIGAIAKLNGNITRINVAGAVGTDRPTPVVKGPLNVLVLGSDTRFNIGTTEFGTDTVEGGPHSDTNLLVHLSADRQSISVVSIPRDSMVMSPADCSDPNSSVTYGVMRQWNQNFNLGGAPCTLKTFEANTGIYVDHVIVIDFLGFKEMVDALGGVPVCTSEDINDKDSGLTLTAGWHLLDGAQALGYVRVRKTLGDGSDLGRIKRQQAFMSSVAQKATQTSLLLRPDKLYAFLNAATKAMTADQDLTTRTLANIANSVKSVGVGKIKFYTVPTQTYEPDPNRVQWTASAADLWSAIREDRPPGGAPTQAPSLPPFTAVSPDQIQVQVVNDTATRGLSSQAVRALVVQGFQAVTAESDKTLREGVIVQYSTGQYDAARTLAQAFPGAVVEEVDGLGVVIRVRLGTGASNPVEVPGRLGTDPLPPMTEVAPSPTPTEITIARDASSDICS